MKACFVCATAWDPHAETCAKCGTAQLLLIELEQRAKQHRFLFGSSRPPQSEPEPEPPPKPVRPQVKKAARPKPEPPAINEPDIFPSSGDLIRERDPIASRPALPEEPRWEQATVLAIDVFLCLLLDLAVFKLVLWFSQRSFMPLVNFSLIPIFFVLLGFTILYFWWFLNIFGRTLGRILLTRYRNR